MFVVDSSELSVIRHTPVGNPEDKYYPTLEINFFHHPFRQANTSTQTAKIYCFNLTNHIKLHRKVLSNFNHGPSWSTKHLSKLKKQEK